MPKKPRHTAPNSAASKSRADRKEELASDSQLTAEKTDPPKAVRDRKWWEEWWGQAILLTITSVVAGVIVWVITDPLSKKPASVPPRNENSSSSANAAPTHPARDPKSEPPAAPAQTAPRKSPDPQISIPTLSTDKTNSRPLFTSTPETQFPKVSRQQPSNLLAENRRPGMGRPGTMATRPGNNNTTAGSRQVSLKGGGRAILQSNGQLRSINQNGLEILYGPHGERTVESRHKGVTIVSSGPRDGYVQRNYLVRKGAQYVYRTYVTHGVADVAVYRSYEYGGSCCYYVYTPTRLYNPVYYGWAGNPWQSPVSYGWKWGSEPWYVYYGGYFAPYAVYPTAAHWLTDYVVASNLETAYQERSDAASANSNAAAGDGSNEQASSGPLTPEVKQAIADEIRAQLANEQTDESSKAPGDQRTLPALDPAQRVFVVSEELTVAAGTGECALTAGDVISRASDTPGPDRKVAMVVASSKKGDCAHEEKVAISLADLQEMENRFREQLDAGLRVLASKQGSGGLPKAPATTTVVSEIPLPLPDATAAEAIEKQEKVADEIVAKVKQELSTEKH